MTLSTRHRVPLLGDILGLQLASNPGAAFSLDAAVTWVLTALSVGVTIVLARFAVRAASIPWAVGIGCIWGGAIGNTLDRLLAPPGFGRGQVTDFLAYGDLFVGNFADISLAVGAAVVLVLTLRSARPESASKRRPR